MRWTRSLPPKLKKIYVQYKVMRGCECCISAKSIRSLLISWCDGYLRNFDVISQNAQNRRSGENYNLLFETYQNSVIQHGHHIYATVADMAIVTMCAYPQILCALTHLKCVLHCCSNF